MPLTKRGGTKRTIDMRAVLNGVMYLLSIGCQWAARPLDLLPRSTVTDYLRRWDEDRTPDRGDHRQPERQGRGNKGGRIDPSGYDAGKKIKGKKRHVLVDTQGPLTGSLFGLSPFLLKLYADSGY